ncbi:DUF6528 family protein [Phytomonospora endophytica]|uniref:Uncharacterized protein n=1 Tax=Phytomonospora endophytica TaxID=714109 RepID=A0A841FZZ6_9ACTN|nr:DUF6528 family protein [Phytomonospora endophytica]MBB6039278.1 hypothetical protein [Phytomonospora endophytica]GIG69779.1 hypothetical protein Pen01_60740 [Phytomonospora endophytica]
MKRRTLLSAAALGVPAAALLGSAPAQAAATFSVVGTEQILNRLMMWNKDTPFTDENLEWSWSPGVGGWFNLSDARFRRIPRIGEVALAAASGGDVGVVEKKHGVREQGLDDLLWSAAPGGNPHAAEYVHPVGAVVTASSSNGQVAGGYLCVYAPSHPRKIETLEQVQVIPFKGAHGVLWDPEGDVLWAIGDKVVRAYEVTGERRDVRLVDTGRAVPLAGLGHDLQPDYTDRGKLFVTDTYGVHHIDKATLTAATVSVEDSVKAYSRHRCGEDVSVRADLVGEKTWGSPTVRFSRSPWQTREGAEFYKARIYTTHYQ